ncbi:MAG: hypothetical protein JWQ87_2272 [Candidatus Sulfotelmatobacter sp.]|nr:hypothetical protein [Candidatus Sulfotelmatobacter sp.]
MKNNSREPAQTAGNAPEPQPVRTGQWFLLESPECTSRFSVQEKTNSGCRIVCSTPFIHDRAKSQLEEIVKSHNERVAASSQEATPPTLSEAIKLGRESWQALNGKCSPCAIGDVPINGLHRGVHKCGNFAAEPAPSPATKETPEWNDRAAFQLLNSASVQLDWVSFRRGFDAGAKSVVAAPQLEKETPPDPSTVLTDDFDAWWAKDGRYYDPDTSDVPWYDKRKGLAEYAYQRGKLVTTRWAESFKPAEPAFDGSNRVPATVEDAIRVLRKIDACSSDTSKLLILKRFQRSPRNEPESEMG